MDFLARFTAVHKMLMDAKAGAWIKKLIQIKPKGMPSTLTSSRERDQVSSYCKKSWTT